MKFVLCTGEVNLAAKSSLVKAVSFRRKLIKQNETARGQTDLERKASFTTEVVQRYDESSVNGGRIKTLIITRKTCGFQP